MMTPLPLPLVPPYYEIGGLRISRQKLRAILGEPHYTEKDHTRTFGGEEDTWAFVAESGLCYVVVLKVPYDLAVMLASNPHFDKQDISSLLGIPLDDEKWTIHATPLHVDFE